MLEHILFQYSPYSARQEHRKRCCLLYTSQSIFQPFFRVDKSRSREYGGAGLGLSLVREIANLHGGSVWVEESSDKGTTIAVELSAGAENDSPGADIP